jgi:hypothetical protein
VTAPPAIEEALAGARALLADCRAAGEALWPRLPGGKTGALRRYRALLEIYRASGASPVFGELEKVVREIERLASESCTCFEPESFRDGFERTVLGHDRRGADALAEVALDRCRRCSRVWLHYFVDDPEVPESSRWYRAPVTEAMAQGLVPQRAAALLESLPWRLQGGAFHGRRGRRVTGPAALD